MELDGRAIGVRRCSLTLISSYLIFPVNLPQNPVPQHLMKENQQREVTSMSVLCVSMLQLLTETYRIIFSHIQVRDLTLAMSVAKASNRNPP